MVGGGGVMSSYFPKILACRDDNFNYLEKEQIKL